MSGRLIITFTGALRITFRFINRLLGFFLVFTGAWFILATRGCYWLYLLYQAHKNNIPYWLISTNQSENKGISIVFWIVAIVGCLFLFIYNCYKFYDVMPDNFLKRLILLFFGRNYSPEREGNNIPPYMLFEKRNKSGFYFGKKRLGFFSDYTRYVCKPTNQDGHVLVVGGAGSGKSAAIAKNTLETWNAPIFALDIKGELSAYYLKLSNRTRPIKIFDPTKGKFCVGYDPYYLLRECGAEYLPQYAREIAIAIVPVPYNIREPFWVQSAQNLLTAAILYYFDLGATFIETITAIQTTPIDKLVDEIAESENIIAKMNINTLRDLKLETLAGIATELSNKIMVFATDPFIRGALQEKRGEENSKYLEYFNINWGDLEKYDIFLYIPEDRIEQWGSVITLMISQLIRTLERRADNSSAAGKDALPVLLLLDEIARIGKITVIKDALATLRSKNVTVSLFIQSLAQLDAIYGVDERRIIIDNCRYKAILNATDADSQTYFSRIVGTCEVEKESRGVQYDVDDGVETGRGSNWSKHREPIIFPHEFAKLKDVVIMTPEGFGRAEKVYAPRHT